MRTFIVLVGILSLVTMMGCGNNCDKAIDLTRRDQVLIDLLQHANEQLATDLKLEKARAENAETKLALSTKSAVEHAESITRTAYESVKRLTPGADATLCVKTWSDAIDHYALFLCKTPSAGEPQCTARVVQTMDARGDQLVSQSDIHCEKWDEMVTSRKRIRR